MKTCLTYIVLLLICLNQGKAQRYISHFQIVKSDSAIAIFEVIRVGCKNYKEIEVLKLDNSIPAEQPPAQRSSQGRNKPVFAFHGNILYNFNFRSYIDTPFSEKNISQHIIQTKINGVYKETFPFTVILTTHKSNSAYYLDGSNVSIQFRQNEMIDNFKKDILNRIENVLSEKFLTLTPSQIYHLENSENSSIKNEIFSEVNSTGLQNKKHQEILENTKKLYKKYKDQVDSLNISQKFYSKLSDAQESVEEKERNIQNKNRESLDSAISANIKIPKNKSELYENKKQKTDSLKREVIKSENELKTFQKRIKDSLQDLKKEVWKISKREDLISYLQKTDNSSGSISGAQKILLSINQVGIGRTWIDYSELTVSNISLSGLNVEANPGKLYVAAAAGKVNYKFQGYILKNKFQEARQSLSLVRLGFGKKDKNNIIFTYYTGKKALQNQVISGDSGLVQQISGISVEATASIDENNYLVAEYARSESPALKGKILDLKTNANEAFCLKLFSRFRSTAITSYYRRAGENFQSFTMLPSNSKQDSWMIRANQQLYKSYILIDTPTPMLRSCSKLTSVAVQALTLHISR